MIIFKMYYFFVSESIIKMYIYGCVWFYVSYIKFCSTSNEQIKLYSHISSDFVNNLNIVKLFLFRLKEVQLFLFLISLIYIIIQFTYF